jgi:hypothetical protein
MHRPASVAAATLVAVMSFGCAHTGANQYAYAPPLAPPVYPQPQTVAQPALTTAPGPVVGAPTLPAAPVVTGVPVSAAGGVIPANADGSCQPCADSSGAVPVSYEAGVQTTPCPPGP